MIIMKLLHSVHFLAKNRLLLTTTFDDMIQLQIENGDEVLKQHVESGPLNAQYISNYSVVTLLDAIDIWLYFDGGSSLIHLNKSKVHRSTSTIVYV